MNKYYFFFTFLLFNYAIYGQITVARNFFAVPFTGDSVKKKFMTRTTFGAEMNVGFGSAENEQRWNAKYYGYVELFRNKNYALAFMLSHELTANPNNNIGFLMRGAIWNENVMLYRKFRNFHLEAGFTHHCRHEIDNHVPPDETKPIPVDYQPTRRLIVITSEHLGIVSKELQIRPKLTARFLARADIFTYFVDGRKPYTNQTQSWDYLRGSGFLAARLNLHLYKDYFIYTRNWLNPLCFTKKYDAATKPFGFNARAEFGVFRQGEKAYFELFGAYERFFDDVSRPYPQPSQALIIGIRGRANTFF